MIASIARWLFEKAFRQMFDGPEIAVDVVAFHLMTGGGAPPEEFIGESFGFIGDP